MFVATISLLCVHFLKVLRNTLNLVTYLEAATSSYLIIFSVVIISMKDAWNYREQYITRSTISDLYIES